MNAREDEFVRRMRELAERALARGEAVLTHFLDPAQLEAAAVAAGRAGVGFAAWGGYEGAERRVAAFCPHGAPDAWPLAAVEITWNERFASPGHRDLLGALMGLGFERERIGDIVAARGRAFLFAEPEIAAFIVSRLEEVGRASVRASLWEGEVPVPPPVGRTARDTVPSLRLDALVAAGFSISRAKAAEYVLRERVLLNHCLAQKGDAPVRAGDLISVRGLGRVRLESVQGPTKKGRLGVILFHFGD